jgi:hypothetical protein
LVDSKSGKARSTIHPGDTFSKWTVIERTERPANSKTNKPFYLCRCVCGSVKAVNSANLKSGRSNQCRRCADRATRCRTTEDFTGQVFGSWTVLEKAVDLDKSKFLGVHWNCRCCCGTFTAISHSRLKSGNSKQCRRCSAHQRGPRKDLTGQVFGKWTVVSRVPVSKRNRPDTVWLCRCECGQELQRSVTDTQKGGSCLKCWGLSIRLRPYEAVFNSIQRGWRNLDFTLTYEDFLAIVQTGRCHYCHIPLEWQKHCHKKEEQSRSYQLDRKDNDLGYTPENVVACCTRCNYAKGARYSYEEWYAMTECFRRQVLPEAA